ncbi:hypothetical protein CapIbe_001194 [Capra ibex]
MRQAQRSGCSAVCCKARCGAARGDANSAGLQGTPFLNSGPTTEDPLFCWHLSPPLLTTTPNLHLGRL